MSKTSTYAGYMHVIMKQFIANWLQVWKLTPLLCDPLEGVSFMSKRVGWQKYSLTFTVGCYVEFVKAIQTSLVRHINWLIAGIDSVRHSKEFNARGLELASLTTLYTMAFLCILAFGYDITLTSNLTLL